MRQGGANTIDGEARVKVEGGFALMPGLDKERVIPFSSLPCKEAQDLVDLAHRAEFFTCAAPGAGHPGARDVRTYTITLRVGQDTREMKVTEPIRDPALAELVSTVRRMGVQQAH